MEGKHSSDSEQIQIIQESKAVITQSKETDLLKTTGQNEAWQVQTSGLPSQQGVYKVLPYVATSTYWGKWKPDLPFPAAAASTRALHNSCSPGPLQGSSIK